MAFDADSTFALQFVVGKYRGWGRWGQVFLWRKRREIFRLYQRPIHRFVWRSINFVIRIGLAYVINMPRECVPVDGKPSASVMGLFCGIFIVRIYRLFEFADYVGWKI